MNLHREISETIDLLGFIVELLFANLLVFNQRRRTMIPTRDKTMVL